MELSIAYYYFITGYAEHKTSHGHVGTAVDNYVEAEKRAPSREVSFGNGKLLLGQSAFLLKERVFKVSEICS